MSVMPVCGMARRGKQAWNCGAAPLCACLARFACGGGSDNPRSPPPATKLNADNLLEATGVSALALHRVQGDLPLALSAVLGPYLQ